MGKKNKGGRPRVTPVDAVATTVRIRKPVLDAARIYARGAGLTLDRLIEQTLVQLTGLEGK